MIVADTSAWIEYLRATTSPADLAMTRLIDEGRDLAVTEVVMMELLAGARDARHLDDLRGRLAAFPMLTLSPVDSYERAAEVWRACRRAGQTVRSLLDCLVAVAALEADAEVLHADRDFEVIARHSPLRLAPLTG